MIITFNNIKLTNFMPFSSANIKLDQDGYILVSGNNEHPDDNAKSNGAGKSTIFEAIIWCLTGETMRGTKDVKRFGTSEKCEVELEFSIDNNKYKIIRSKDPTNLQIFINNENKSGKGIRDSQKLLEDYLPDLTAQLIGSVIIMGQGLPMRFTSNSPSGRKDALEKLSKSDFMIEDLKSRVSTRKNYLSSKKREFEDLILKNKTLIQSKNNDIKYATEQILSLQNIDYDVVIEIKNKELLDLNCDVDKINEKISETQAVADETTQNLSELYKIKSTDQDSLQGNYQTTIQSIREELNNSRSIESNLQTDINKINNIKTHCPTCGQKLEGITKPDVTPYVEKLTAQQLITKDKLDQLQKIQTELQSKLSDINNLYLNKELELKQKIKDYKDKILQLKSDLSSVQHSVTTIQSELNTLEVQKSNLAYKLEQNKNLVELANESIIKSNSIIKTSSEQLMDIEARIDIINKFDTVLKRDFRGILLTNIINYIDKDAKEYSKIVFGTDKLDFKLNGNNIDILYCGKAYENLSGGEKQRVDLIIQFSLRDMLCKYLNFSSNILVLDEIVDNLDSVGCQKIMELISTKLNDVGSIYIISHHADLPMPSDYELKIIKNKNGVSYVAN